MASPYRAALVLVCTGPRDRPHRYTPLEEILSGAVLTGAVPLSGLHVKHLRAPADVRPAGPLTYVPRRRREQQVLRFECPECGAHAEWDHDELNALCDSVAADHEGGRISEPRRVLDLSVRRSLDA